MRPRAPPFGLAFAALPPLPSSHPAAAEPRETKGRRKTVGERAIGFIGVGRMGLPMAARLIAAGHRLVAYDVQGQALSAIAGKGAETAASPAEVASRAEIVMASLPRPEIVREVALGERGVAAGSKARIFVDLSTTGPRTAQAIAAELATRNIIAIDAPVSGGVAGATKGTLAVMTSGPKAECEALRPLLQAIGKVFYIGAEPGMGQMMKLINNLLSATATAATSEAVVLGVKAGLDPHVMIDVINAGSGRTTASEDKFPRAILPRSFDYGFALGLMSKDVNLCIAEADALQVPMWIGNAVKQLWLYGLGQGGPDQDFTELIKHLEKWAGVTVGGKKPAG
ncbi:MAG TPA: NAD(P)-dependent oxidoreductase [Stellaceae bacterium]